MARLVVIHLEVAASNPELRFDREISNLSPASRGRHRRAGATTAAGSAAAAAGRGGTAASRRARILSVLAEARAQTEARTCRSDAGADPIGAFLRRIFDGGVEAAPDGRGVVDRRLRGDPEKVDLHLETQNFLKIKI